MRGVFSVTSTAFTVAVGLCLLLRTGLLAQLPSVVTCCGARHVLCYLCLSERNNPLHTTAYAVLAAIPAVTFTIAPAWSLAATDRLPRSPPLPKYVLSFQLCSSSYAVP